MSRRVRRKGWHPRESEKDVVEVQQTSSFEEDCLIPKSSCALPPAAREVNWTGLPDDTVLQLFSRLNYRDRASLASTCRHWRLLGSSPCLWTSLDLRTHHCDASTARSLSSRCSNLSSLRFRGQEAASAVMHLRARGLLGISGDFCRDMTDSTLSVLVARHELLESLQIGPEPCDKITGDAIRAVALCCPHLRRIRLTGVWEIDADAIRALSINCRQLEEIAFLDCGGVDESALGEVTSLRFLSVAGTRNMNWDAASHAWAKLPRLVGLDVSRTDVPPSAVLRLWSSKTLKVLNALNCPILEQENNNLQMSGNFRGKVFLSRVMDIFKGIGSLYRGNQDKVGNEKIDVFEEWRNGRKRGCGMDVDDLMSWLEWILSQTLLRIAESNPLGAEAFWLHQENQVSGESFWLQQGTSLLLSLVKSAQEDVRERAITTLSIFVVTDDDNASVDPARSEAVMREGGIPLLLELAKSCREGVQSEAAKALANLSVNPKVAKAVADRGGISILAELATSRNKLVAEEAAGGLWNLSVGEEHKGAITEAGGVKVLVDIILKWPAGSDGVLERAAGALANLAADDKCSLEVAAAGGVRALVILARYCKVEGVQEQAARALANLAAHGDSNSNNSAVGQEAGALEALVQLTCSPSEGVRQEAAGALWNLSFDDRNREAIASVGGVEALVVLAHSCLNASQGLQERAAGALWGLSVSEANSDAIGQEGGVAPLIALARSDVEDVHETAAGALWNLAFNPENALRIVGEGGVSALVDLCSSSGSKMARFMAALALAYMFDGRMDGVAPVGTSGNSSKSMSLDGAKRMALKHIEAFVCTFSDPQSFSSVASSSSLALMGQVTEEARIKEAGHLRCSGAEIARFVSMLRNPSSILRSCAAFALVQFTIPGGRHTTHHVHLLQNSGAGRVLRSVAAATTAPVVAKVFARMVLRNLEQQQLEHHPLTTL